MNKILIIDDEKEICESIKMILDYEGYDANFSTSAIQGIKILEENSTSCLLLDIQMPEMNGIEATKEIRKIRKNLPIIAQTAFIFEDDKDIILEAGCDACLIKPIRKEHLLTVMSGFVNSNQQT